MPPEEKGARVEGTGMKKMQGDIVLGMHIGESQKWFGVVKQSVGSTNKYNRLADIFLSTVYMPNPRHILSMEFHYSPTATS